MTERTSSSPETAELPRDATDRNHLRKVATRSSRSHLDGLRESVLDAHESQILDGNIPPALVNDYEGSLDAFIANNPERFGYERGAKISREDRASIVTGLKQHTDIFRSDVFDKMRWKKEHKEKLIKSSRASFEKNFGTDCSKIPDSALRGKTIEQLEELTKSISEQRKIWNQYVDESITDKTPEAITSVVKKLKLLLEEGNKNDPQLKYARKQLERFNDPHTQSLPPDVFQILFRRDIIDDTEVENMTQWLLPILPLSQIEHVGIPLDEIEGYSFSNNLDEDTEKSKQGLKRKTLQNIPTQDLRIGHKKLLLQSYGSKGIADKIHELVDGPDATDHDSFGSVSQKLGYNPDDYSYKTREGFKEYLEKHNEQSKKKNKNECLTNIDGLTEGSVIQRFVQTPDKKTVVGYYRVISFPDGFIPPEEGGEMPEDQMPPGEMVTLQYIGDKKHGIIKSGGTIANLGHEDFFHFLTGQFQEGTTTHANILDVSSWNAHLGQESTKKRDPEEYEYTGERGLAKGLRRLTEDEKVESDGIQESMTLTLLDDGGAKSYLSLHSYNPTNDTLKVYNGQEYSGMMTTAGLLSYLDELKKKGTKVEYFGDHRPSLEESLDQLKKADSTKDHFKDVSINKNMFSMGDSEDNSVPLQIMRLNRSREKGAEGGNDINIQSIDDSGMVKYSLGEFIQAKKVEGAFQKAVWKGCKPVTCHISALSAFMEKMGHKPEAIKESIEPTEWDNKEEEPSILKSIIGLGYLGALPFAFKKPFEAWKEDREMILEMNGNQAAMLFVSSVPGVRNMDWANVLRGNTSQNIKNNVEKIAESIGGCYSVLRQDLIHRYSHRYNHPHPKFIGALMATISEYGNLYYSKNTKKFTPWFWYCKIRGIDPNNYKDLVKDRFTQQEAKIIYYGSKDIAQTAPDLTWEQLQTVNEMQMTHQAFVGSEKKFPQYSNFYRMFQKYQSKSVSAGPGKDQLSEKTDDERHEWMMKQVASGRVTEMVDGFGLWLEEEFYTSHFKLEPVMALFLSNRISKAPVALANQIRDMMKDKSVLVPAFAFLDTAQDLDLFRRSSVEIAYIIGDDAGKELQGIVENFDKIGKNNNINVPLGDFSKFWKTYGQEMIDLMSVMKDPRMLLAIQQERGDPEARDTGFPAMTNSASGKYKGNLTSFMDKIKGKFTEENTMAIRSRCYKGESFRVNSDRGYAPIILDLPNWFDRNFEKAFANGQNSIEGDGVWGELMKIIRNIPNYAEKHAASMGKAGDKKVIDNIAYMYFRQMRDGLVSKNGGIRESILKSNLFTENILRAPYWTRDAIIFDLAGPPETVAPKENFLEWLKERILISQKVAAAYEAGGTKDPSTQEITEETQKKADSILDFYSQEPNNVIDINTGEPVQQKTSIPTEVAEMTEEERNGGQQGFKKYIINQAYLLTGQRDKCFTDKSTSNGSQSQEEYEMEEFQNYAD